MKNNFQKQLDRAYDQVRNELCELGLLSEGNYLDHIQVFSVNKFVGKIARADGWVWDEERPSRLYRLFGFKDGDIYIPASIYEHGYNYLVKTIRHEYAHAWKWMDPEFFREAWFSKTFSGEYEDDFSESGKAILKNLGAFEERFCELGMERNFESPYAATCPAEDFAETFAAFMANRRSTPKWPNRPGVRRKVEAVRRAVVRKAKHLKL